MRVLLRRHGDGIGDWLFMLACIKHVNQQAPDVDIVVDFNLEPRQGRARTLPPIVREAYVRSDAKFTELDGEAWPITAFDVIVPHVLYGLRARDRELPYVESMLETFSTLLGRSFHYDRALLPRFVYPEYRARPKSGYVAMVSRGKRETAYKDWPPRQFRELAGALHEVSSYAIAHVGCANDWPLEYTEPHFDLNFEQLAGLLAGADLFIGLENGVSVLASWLGTKTIVIYQRSNMAQRWSGPAVARLVRPLWNDVAAIAVKELTC